MENIFTLETFESERKTVENDELKLIRILTVGIEKTSMASLSDVWRRPTNNEFCDNFFNGNIQQFQTIFFS